ncbi:MAG: restriction endonuclease [Elusimicrobia bacterium]|nr:restriction endonuclease [Elusimicrobiota bacterium]
MDPITAGIILFGIITLIAMFVEGRRAVKTVRRMQQEHKTTETRNLEVIAQLNKTITRITDDCQSKINAAYAAMEAHEKNTFAEAEERFAKQKDALRQKYHDEARKIISEAAAELPWLARALAQYETMFDFEMGRHLANKKHPAPTAAQQVKEIAAQSRRYREEFHVARLRLEYYEELFPWLVEYIDVSLDELLELVRKDNLTDESQDPVSRYLAPGEFRSLSISDRNQRALDHYLSRKKSPWELGRDYERYIGYRYERQGYSVEYHGISEGLSDLGRDLIIRSKDEVKIIQCKYWAAHKEIHEKHIAQLFGTTVKFAIENNLQWGTGVRGVLITSTKLSSMAKSFASALGVEFQESVPLEKYPIIKCNIGREADGAPSRIYHLPMDQQYDKTRIAKAGEFYASSVAEAVSHGFRRAWRWHPPSV